MEDFDLKIFDSITGEEWRQYVNKELRGATWEDLVWHIHDKVKLEPGYHADDDYKTHFLPNTLNGEWLIGESFDTKGMDPTDVNREILTALQYGLESPKIKLDKEDEKSKVKTVISGVFTDYVELHWDLNSPKLLIDIIKYTRKLSTGEQMVKGAYLFPIVADRDLPELLFEVNGVISEGQMGPHRVIHIAPEVEKRDDDIIYGANVLAAANAAIEFLLESRHPVDRIVRTLHVTVRCGHNLLFEIAALRALRCCLNNLVREYDSSYTGSVFIDAYTDSSIYTDDANYNRISGSLISWAMALGGADRITTIPGSLGESSFDRRTARNVHHLMRMESFLGQVIDPLSGSYYIESATTQIAEAMWSTFKKINKDSPYFEGKPLNG